MNGLHYCTTHRYSIAYRFFIISYYRASQYSKTRGHAASFSRCYYRSSRPHEWDEGPEGNEPSIATIRWDKNVRLFQEPVVVLKQIIRIKLRFIQTSDRKTRQARLLSVLKLKYGQFVLAMLPYTSTRSTLTLCPCLILVEQRCSWSFKLLKFNSCFID